MTLVQVGYTFADVATCTNLYRQLPMSEPTTSQQSGIQTICRSQRTSLQHHRTIRMCSSTHMQPSLLTNGGAIWSRSSDGPFWSFEGEHEKHGWGEDSRREVSFDKRWGALMSLAVPSPASPAQSDTHVWCWSAGAYPIMDVDMRSAESYRCLD